MKVCFKCAKRKAISSFYKHSEMADGHLNKCKECAKKDVAENQADYDSTEKGVIRVIYKSQKSNMKRRKMKLPEYSKRELRSWLYKNGYKELYLAWVKSGNKKDLKPSVDRIDSTKGYKFSNIRLVTWGQNRAFQAEDIMSGRGTSGRRCKPVAQYRNGKKVSEHVSAAQAKRAVGRAIWHLLGHNGTDMHGSTWRYN